MSLEFVINGEASAGAWEKPGPLQLHAPNGGNLTKRPFGGRPIPRPLAVVDYFCGLLVSIVHNLGASSILDRAMLSY